MVESMVESEDRECASAGGNEDVGNAAPLLSRLGDLNRPYHGESRIEGLRGGKANPVQLFDRSPSTPPSIVQRRESSIDRAVLVGLT